MPIRLAVHSLRAAAVAALLALAVPAVAAVGLHVSGTDIVEGNGKKFILRGVSHEHVWFTNQTMAFTDIASYRSNVVRVVLSGGRWTASTPTDVANVIGQCKANKLICVLEDHDTTGYGEDGAAYTLDQAVTFWSGLQSVLVGQEDYVIINIGNEPIGNNNPGQWVAATTSAIARMRSLGFQHLLMVDAPNWGQDWQYVMRDNAATVLAADPQKNTVLSIHMYGVFNTASSITSYLQTFKDAGWPLVIGEFGYNNNSSANVDHETVMSAAQSMGIGYMGWSWCGNNDPYLDMVVSWNPNNLSPWGRRILNGVNGIVETAQVASVFGGPTGYTLTVANARPSYGTVSGGGINCGTTCSATYTGGTAVTLTAAATSLSSFSGWSGCTSTSGATCIVSMTQDRTVTATFSDMVTRFPLTVARAGTGSGTVTSTPSGIDCGSTCGASYAPGTAVTLTATAAGGSTFGSWSGCASTSGPTCTVSMTQSRTVTATFTSTVVSYALTVARAGTGSGTVTSNTGGIACGTACTASYASGAAVTLTATAAGGSTFGSWSGCTSASGATCTVSMTAARTVTATFTGSGGTTPCANAITFTGNTSNFNTTGAVCYRTSQTINGWGCFNMDGRTLSVNNTATTCGKMPLPAKWSDGYTYFSVTAGTYPWAGIYAW